MRLFFVIVQSLQASTSRKIISSLANTSASDDRTAAAELAYTPANSSKQPARARPKGSLQLLCAFCTSSCPIGHLAIAGAFQVIVDYDRQSNNRRTIRSRDIKRRDVLTAKLVTPILILLKINAFLVESCKVLAKI